jgi:putative ABC transport system substrate-binding protein
LLIYNNPFHGRSHRWIILVWMGLIILVLTGCSSIKPKVVGILSGLDAFADTTDGFISQMTKLGYEKDKNIIYDVYKINPDPVKEQEILNKFVADKVDLIFTFPTGPALLAKAITRGKDIPVVFAIGTIEGNDLVQSVRAPGGNITGVRFPGAGLTLKRFEILLEIAPKTKRVLLIYEWNYPPALDALNKLRPEALSAGITLVEAPVRKVDEIKSYLQARAKSGDIGVDAILIMPEPLAQTPEGWASISEFAYKYKLPISGVAAFEVRQGAVFTYIPDDFETGELAANLAHKIFKGIPAGTIPVVTPESELKINYNLVKELNLKVSENLLCQAKEIIH